VFLGLVQPHRLRSQTGQHAASRPFFFGLGNGQGSAPEVDLMMTSGYQMRRSLVELTEVFEDLVSFFHE